jgi:DNA-binding beta-propeller fold protein YncE
MKSLLFLIIVGFLFNACNLQQKKNSSTSKDLDYTQHYTLELIWESDSVFQTPESVLYDTEKTEVYVANINKRAWEKDGNGFISKLDLDGNVLNLKWIDGLDGPKGMGLVDSILYVANIDEVVKINTNTGQIVQRIKANEGDGLNDITAGKDGFVFVSSSSNSKLYKIENDKLILLNQGGDERYNGLLYERDRVMLLTNKGSQLKSYDLGNNELTVLVDSGLGRADGIVSLGEDGYLTSDWRGEIFYIDSTYVIQSLLNTQKQNINTADIDYIQEKMMLLIPTFFDNRVLAYKLIKN